MDILLFIVGVFFIWKGQIKIDYKSNPWPKNKKIGRIIGVLMLMPLIIEELFIFFK